MATEIVRDLSDINAELKATQKEFNKASKEAKELTKSLKADQNNNVLKSFKIDELTRQIEACTKKVELLKEKQQSLKNSGVKENTTEYKRLEAQIAITESTAKSLKDQTVELKKKVNDLDSAKLDKLKKGFSSVSKVALGFVSSVVAIGKVFASKSDEIQKKVDKFGGTAEQWQYQSNAWDKLTGDGDAYEQVLQAVTSTQGQAQKESSKLGTMLEQLGLTFEDVQGKTSTEALQVYIDALARVGDEATRQAIAVALFGSNAGTYIAQMAGTGSEAINQWNSELADAGVLTNEQVRQGAELQDTFDYLGQTIKKLVADLGTSFKPMVEGLITLIKGIAPIITAIGKALSGLGPGGTVAIAVFGAMIAILPPLITMLAALNWSTGRIGAAIAALGILATATAIGAGVYAGINTGSNESTNNAPVVDTSGFVDESSTLEENNQQGTGSQASGSGNTYNNTTNYYDNSTMNNEISKDVDYEEMTDYLTEKKRVLIGG